MKENLICRKQKSCGKFDFRFPRVMENSPLSWTIGNNRVNITKNVIKNVLDCVALEKCELRFRMV